MKKLLLSLILAVSPVLADTVATMNNDGGGIMVLTDVPCKDGGGYHMYSQSPNYRTLFGCWWSDSSMVHVTWYDGEVRSYPLALWRVNLEVARRMRKGTNL
jgi:hypothetical protein